MGKEERRKALAKILTEWMFEVPFQMVLFDFHHRVPAARGGADGDENLALICAGCHSRARSKRQGGGA